MYNSVVVRFLVRIWEALVFYYDKSLVKRIGQAIGGFFSRISRGSVIKSIFTDDLDILENTIFYRIYGGAVDLYNRLAEKINKNTGRAQETSEVSQALGGLFKDNLELVKTFSIFAVFFGLGLVVNSLARGLVLSVSNIGALVLIALGLIVLSLGEKNIEIFNNSWTVNLVLDMFRVEEGGDQWW